MIEEWYNSVNQSAEPQKVENISEYIESIENKSLNESPIDKFYKSSIAVIKIASNPAYLVENMFLGPLLLIGIISCTENYFREIMAEAIKICPICKAKSATQTISLGSVLWNYGIDLEKGSFENLSFADSDTIVKTCKKFLDYDIDKKGLTYSLLEEFDKICELRHGIVHSNNILAGKNAIKLGIKSEKKLVKVKVLYKQLQECAAICTALVNSFNTDLFKLMAKRWAVDWTKLESWDSKSDNESFGNIWKMFYSDIDSKRHVIPQNISMIKCRNYVKREYNR